jgi:plasmid stabilization system protein ParE
MSHFAFHPEAFTDLTEIWEFIAADNVDAADRVIGEIFDVVGSLAAFPHQGRRTPGVDWPAFAFRPGAGVPDRLRS